MLKLFNDFAKALFASHMAQRFPNYRIKKSLRICTPPPTLPAMVFEQYASSSQCEEYIDCLYASMLRTHTRNPPNAEQNRNEFLQSERYRCNTLWSHLAKRHDFSDDELLLYTDPVVADAMDLVRTYGIPLIARQLGADSSIALRSS